MPFTQTTASFNRKQMHSLICLQNQVCRLDTRGPSWRGETTSEWPVKCKVVNLVALIQSSAELLKTMGFPMLPKTNPRF